MMSGVPLETCWAFKKLWNNRFYFKAASCWYFYWPRFILLLPTYHMLGPSYLPRFEKTKTFGNENIFMPLIIEQSWTAWLLKVGRIGCPKTSVTKYKFALRNIQEEWRSRLHGGGSLKSLLCSFPHSPVTSALFISRYLPQHLQLTFLTLKRAFPMFWVRMALSTEVENITFPSETSKEFRVTE